MENEFSLFGSDSLTTNPPTCALISMVIKECGCRRKSTRLGANASESHSVPGKSPYRTSSVPLLHSSGWSCVNQALGPVDQPHRSLYFTLTVGSEPAKSPTTQACDQPVSRSMDGGSHVKQLFET